ncbi:LRR receptor-like serine/threonine-protein kinase GSO1-like [Planoprotostelium fungivorum]|uniref:LRR receptor-like serine/threonine-protein kinase GSO1-like n=1 Tax=Planoprotostelium fungivorum TaxID=1890364 RepID=A0A2P6N6Y0_9EUKA|nr:LRR receptor-like serine/threonine-protein kinase GSO1-like [Planoprotostelium fungivorum]
MREKLGCHENQSACCPRFVYGIPPSPAFFPPSPISEKSFWLRRVDDVSFALAYHCGTKSFVEVMNGRSTPDKVSSRSLQSTHWTSGDGNTSTFDTTNRLTYGGFGNTLPPLGNSPSNHNRSSIVLGNLDHVTQSTTQQAYTSPGAAPPVQRTLRDHNRSHIPQGDRSHMGMPSQSISHDAYITHATEGYQRPDNFNRYKLSQVEINEQNYVPSKQWQGTTSSAYKMPEGERTRRVHADLQKSEGIGSKDVTSDFHTTSQTHYTSPSPDTSALEQMMQNLNTLRRSNFVLGSDVLPFNTTSLSSYASPSGATAEDSGRIVHNAEIQKSHIHFGEQDRQRDLKTIQQEHFSHPKVVKEDAAGPHMNLKTHIHLGYPTEEFSPASWGSTNQDTYVDNGGSGNRARPLNMDLQRTHIRLGDRSAEGQKIGSRYAEEYVKRALPTNQHQVSPSELRQQLKKSHFDLSEEARIDDWKTSAQYDYTKKKAEPATGTKTYKPGVVFGDRNQFGAISDETTNGTYYVQHEGGRSSPPKDTSWSRMTHFKSGSQHVHELNSSYSRKVAQQFGASCQFPRAQTMRDSITSLVLFLCVVTAQLDTACLMNRLNGVKNGSVPFRGVNLGSWLVAEYSVTPQLWDDHQCDPKTTPGQYLLEKCLRQQSVTLMNQTLEQHWNNWITEMDFVQMAEQGLNSVRLPIGWWSIYDTIGGTMNSGSGVIPLDHATGSLKYIDRAFDWGNQYGIGIILDMQAAPGSQNGQDESSPSVNNEYVWDLYQTNIDQTTQSIKLYTMRYCNYTSFLGFSLLNKPGNAARALNMDLLQQFYRTAYNTIRQYSNDSFVIISPLSAPSQTGTESIWVNFMIDSTYKRVYVDMHYTLCQQGAYSYNDDDRLQYINNISSLIDQFNQVNSKLLYVGEWNLCGISRDKAHFAASNLLQTFSAAGGGWSYWNWKSNQTWSTMKTAFTEGWMAPNATGIPFCSTVPGLSSIYSSPWSSLPTPTSAVTPTTSPSIDFEPSPNCSSSRMESLLSQKTPVRATSLYGWLVLDSSVTPWLWTSNNCSTTQDRGTYLLTRCLGGRDNSVLKRHWNTFVTEDDFRSIARSGLNAVNIPIGWWTIYDTKNGAWNGCSYVLPNGFTIGTLHYLDLAFLWATKWNLGVILDITAAPGGQNQEEGASSISLNDYFFGGYNTNTDCMSDALDLLMNRYGAQSQFIGINVLKRPGTRYQEYLLSAYWQRSYNTVRKYTQTAFVIIDLPADQNMTSPYWVSNFSPPNVTNVWLSYQITPCSTSQVYSDDDKIADVSIRVRDLIQNYNSVNPKPLIVDAWNGCGVTLDRTGELIRAELQTMSFATGGWIFDFWPYANDPSKSMQSMYDYGLITPSQTGLVLCDVLSVNAPTPTGCPDCDALTDIYLQTGGPQWFSQWTLPITSHDQYCQFQQIYCDGSNRVFSLYLSNNNLNGRLPDSIGNMTHLDFLSFAGNQLSGSIPSTIGQLVRLTYLDLSNNGFSGSLPDSVGRLVWLQWFYLNGNLFSGNLPSSLANLDQLMEFNIQNNRMKGPVTTVFDNKRRLTNIDLSQNFFSGTFPHFANCTSLLQVKAYNNIFEGSISPAICSSRRLVLLNIGFNVISGSLPACVGQSDQLQELTADGNKISGNVRSTNYRTSSDTNNQFPQMISTKLNKIDVSQNQFTGRFPDVSQCVSLQELHISNNFFTGSLPLWLGNVTSLTILSLDNNGFTGSLPYNLNGLIHLNTLYLQSNSFSGQLPDMFQPWKTSLQNLDLSYNSLEGTLPPSLYTLSAINVISLGNNRFSGNFSAFDSAGNLLVLNLQSNDFSGRFPFLIAKSIASLTINGNGFTGSNWTWLSSMSNLQIFDVSDNLFTGSLPPFSSRTLTKWDFGIISSVLIVPVVLRNNSFSGAFPLASSNQLAYIDVSHNQFSGSSYYLFPSCASLQTLIFNDNQFTSYLSNTISSCTFLQTIDGTNNMMYGLIPTGLSGLTNLRTIRLGNNSFTGILPSMTRLASLQELSLNDNMLTSNLTQLTSLNQLTTLDLSNNPLNTRVDDSISKMINLRSLDLTNTGLYGIMPASFWNLRSLQSISLGGNILTGTINSITCDPIVLDMRGNSFHGSLEWLGRLSSLTHLDLSLNSFNGSVPPLSLKGIQYLNLAGNLLSGNLPSVSGLTSLNLIDLSLNFFSGVINDFPPSIQFLNVSHNQLEDVSLTSPLYQIISCDMTHNSFQCPLARWSQRLCNSSCTIDDLVHTSQFRMRIQGTLSQFNRSVYIETLSQVTGASSDRFNISNVREGSVIVDASVSPPSNKTSEGSSTRIVDMLGLKSIQQQLASLGVSVLNYTSYIPSEESSSTDTITAAAEKGTSSNGIDTKPIIIGAVVGGSVLILLFVSIIIALAFRKRFVTHIMHQTIDLSNLDFSSAKKSIVNYQEIQDMKEIGSGAFGIVFKGIWRELTVAVKQIRAEHVSKEQVESFLKEVEILQNLKGHPNVVLFIGMTVPPQPLTMVTEFCDGGSLYDYIRGNRVDMKLKYHWINGIALGMLHLHKENLAVRNILLTKFLEPKVSDFGMSRVTESAENEGAQTAANIGPIKWMSPEALRERNYSQKSDVWSFGVVIWEIIEESDPFPGINPIEVAIQIVSHGERLHIPNTDPQLQTLMNMCWAELPQDRPNFAQIVRMLTQPEVVNEEKEKEVKEEDVKKEKEYREMTYSPLTLQDTIQ